VGALERTMQHPRMLSLMVLVPCPFSGLSQGGQQQTSPVHGVEDPVAVVVEIAHHYHQLGLGGGMDMLNNFAKPSSLHC
jgi:hypothetical protein